jgi:hypothetical protein
MLREIAIEEEMPGDFQTTFRLRVDGSVIAENMTELETQFLVSEMIERIPSLRVAASDDVEQSKSDSAARLRLVADDVCQRVFGSLAREEARARPSGNVAEL